MGERGEGSGGKGGGKWGKGGGKWGKGGGKWGMPTPLSTPSTGCHSICFQGELRKIFM